LDDGLADTATWGDLQRRLGEDDIPADVDESQAFVRIQDPAVGTGVFLVEAIERVYRSLCTRWLREGNRPEAIQGLWNCYVPRQLLPRLAGLELMLPAGLMATMLIADKLAATGYQFRTAGRIRVYVADTLVGPDEAMCDSAVQGRWGHEFDETWQARYGTPATVMLGNPPFSGISQNRSLWIEGLLKGKLDAGRGGYYDVNGEPLGERKLWLQDDYVKFLRFAQWHLERAGRGILGFVTNHGYLDNASFRGMRQQLLDVFPRISILDLHGNRKKNEVTPTGDTDENVFPVEQGVAIGLFRKPIGSASARVEHADLWGSQQEKIRLLSQKEGLQNWQRLTPTKPHYLLTPRDVRGCDVYERAFGLHEAMPVNSTAAVTARDGFVIAFDELELVQRMRVFRNLDIPAQEIRRRFFTNSRSKKYLPGDTRGWKLEAARQRMAEDAQWDRHTRTCLYRPFDRRVIYWTDWMIDWPRRDVMRHMIQGENLALVTRRQMLPTQPCNFFWVSDSIVIDGLIRSDNRGSESLFPLYLRAAEEGDPSVAPSSLRPNFATEFIETIERTSKLNWCATPTGQTSQSFGPEDLVAYIYGLFHSPSYRQRYADWLRVEFPRVVLPLSGALFRSISRLGAQLIHLHVGPPTNHHEPHPGNHDTERPDLEQRVSGTNQSRPTKLARGYPRHRAGQIQFNDGFAVGGVPASVWQFHVGGHQVCKKWLTDRRARELGPFELAQFRQIVAAIRETLRTTSAIDREIDRHGGWVSAFIARGES